MIRRAFSIINKILPKFDHVIVQGFPNVESGAIEVANYISSHYNFPVYFPIDNRQKDNPRTVLNPQVIIVEKTDLRFRLKYLTSRYLFFTHGSFFNTFSKNQIAVNLWHGLLYKNVGQLLGKEGIKAHVTVGTSKISQQMFARAFGVQESTVSISGYPRNDRLLRASENKELIKSKIGGDFKDFEKLVIWMPTYRKSILGDKRLDGLEVENPFYIKDFDVAYFNSLLKAENALCIVKPHPMAPKFDTDKPFENLLFVDDKWISDRRITLYDLVGCTDILISDVSSVMIDYLLLDQPIVCVSTDFEEYKKSRGFYFEDIENWIPSKIIKKQKDFFDYLKMILKDNRDAYEIKRTNLKDIFFVYQDDKNTERLIESVFKIR